MAMFLSACTTQSGLPRATTVPPAPVIEPGLITTIEQYEHAQEIALMQVANDFTGLSGRPRLVAVVEALQKLPSAPSRAYAKQLADTLQKYNISVFPPHPNASSPSITYEELAQSYVLTKWLLINLNETASSATQMSVPTDSPVSYDLLRDLMRIVATAAPGDDAALVALYLPFSGASGNITPPIWKDDSDRMKEFHELLPRCMSRYVSPRRELNLTSLSFFSEYAGTSFSIFLADYSNAQKARVDSDHLTPQARNVGFALISSAERALVIDKTPAAQNRLHSFIKGAKRQLAPAP